MTFLILAETISQGKQLTVQLQARAPKSLCLEMTNLEDVTTALGEVLVDCIVLRNNVPFCNSADAQQQPLLVLWPEELDAVDFAKQLLP